MTVLMRPISLRLIRRAPLHPVLTRQALPTTLISRSFMASTPAQAPMEQAAFAKVGYGKRPYNGGNKGGNKRGNQKKLKKTKAKNAIEGSVEEVLMADIQALKESRSDPAGVEAAIMGLTEVLPEPGTEIEVEVLKLSSTGDALACQPGSRQIYVVPFSIPGDTVRVKVYRHLIEEQHSVADFISVVKPSPLRDDSRIKCKYFGKCGGCQFQMMDYSDQLAHKKTIVERAYKNFSQLPPELVPQIQDTIGSPLQYGYRTKLTPHFDAPPGASFGRRGKLKDRKVWETVPEIGFMQKSTRRTLDIEDCPIGTEAVRNGMARERARMKEQFGLYERGATILLREDTKRLPKGEGETTAISEPVPEYGVKVETDKYTDIKTCVTNSNAITTEYIDDFMFTNPAGSFFQNNNSILPAFTDFIRQHILPPPPSSTSDNETPQKPIKYLIDAYSGSGLFTITLASLFHGGSIGIDIAENSITFARANARLNNLFLSQCKFIAADASKLFESVARFDPDETVVVLDPPRKGCDSSFLTQLLDFAPRRVVYVSCNVHSQARDVGVLVRGEVDGMVGYDWDEKKKTRYEIESIRGFDFFPQTGHVEGVTVLNRVVEG